MLISLLAYHFPSWTRMAHVVSLFGLPQFMLFLVMPESPWWLHSQGKIKEANLVMRSIVEGTCMC